MSGERHDDLRDARAMMWLCLVLAALVALTMLTAALVETPLALLDPLVRPQTEVT